MAATAVVVWPLAQLSRYCRLAAGQSEGADLLMTAASTGDFAGVRRALDEGVPPDALYDGCTALQVAGDPAVVRLLLQHGADPSVWHAHRSPLISAASTGNVETAELLLNAGADPNEHEPGFPSPLEAARLWRCDAMVQLLLRHGAHP